MKLPSGDAAIVDDRKLLDYVLNPMHPIGRHHAALFAELLGIGQQNYRILKDALLAAAKEEEVQPGRSSVFGRRYEMRFMLTGPRGSRTVLAIWLIEAGADRPRLITCYVE